MLTPIDQMPRTTPTAFANRPSIKFSADYVKLHGQREAILLAVEPITIDIHTPDELLDYDTLRTDGGRYPLKHGEYIQLVFLGADKRIPFCTIRSRTHWFNGTASDKLSYYKKKIGLIFNLDIPRQKGDAE